MTFIGSSLTSGKSSSNPNICTTGLFAFGAARESAIEAEPATPPSAHLPAADECPDFFADLEPPGEGVAFPPIFSQHFHARLASGNKPCAAATDPSASTDVGLALSQQSIAKESSTLINFIHKRVA